MTARAKAQAREPLPNTSPGRWGALLGMALGLGLLTLGVSSVLRDRPLPLPLMIGLCLAGSVETVMCWFTLQRVRVAWSFAVAISGTSGLAFLFSAPKIRDGLGLSLGVALLPCVAGALTAILLAMAADDIK